MICFPKQETINCPLVNRLIHLNIRSCFQLSCWDFQKLNTKTLCQYISEHNAASPTKNPTTRFIPAISYFLRGVRDLVSLIRDAMHNARRYSSLKAILSGAAVLLSGIRSRVTNPLTGDVSLPANKSVSLEKKKRGRKEIGSRRARWWPRRDMDANTGAFGESR